MEITLNIFEDFFINYPDLSTAFQHIKDTYGSNASRVMWALCLDVHPKSTWRVYNKEERRKNIENYYYEDSLDWEKHNDDMLLLTDLCLSKKQRFLIGWENKLEERQELINSHPYTMATWEDLDKLMASTDKLWKQYMVCLKDVKEEENLAIGGSQESLTELGVI